MKLPKKIKVGDTWYEVNLVKTLDEPGAMGSTNFRNSMINVATHSNIRDVKYRKEDVQETFWHEVTHAILSDMNNKLTRNEKFVTAFAHRLSNAINSVKF
jgi:hypothetical protein